LKVSIIIVAHNKAEYSQLCLESLCFLTYRPIEIVFVDNGSTDNTQKVLKLIQRKLKEANIELHVIRLKRNEGAIKSRNVALKATTGDFVIFLDNDVAVRSRKLLEDLTNFLKRNPHVGAVGPKLVYPCYPYLIQCAGGITYDEAHTRLLGRGEPRDSLEFNVTHEADWLLTACMMVPRGVIDEIGEFDLAFHPIGYEDVDYCYRIKERGYKIAYFSESEMYHFENTSSSGTIGLNIINVYEKNRQIFFRKWKHRITQRQSINDTVWIEKSVERYPLIKLSELEII
jgi:O-antigen biosynthesis protein